jgi:hypothetical protein
MVIYHFLKKHHSLDLKFQDKTIALELFNVCPKCSREQGKKFSKRVPARYSSVELLTCLGADPPGCQFQITHHHS